jgi:hypothetical protein
MKKYKLKDGSILGVEKIKFYSYAASALVNGDYSGCTEEDENEIEAWLDLLQEYARENGVSFAIVVGCTEETEFTYPDLLNGLRGDILEYTVHFHIN